MHSAPDPNTDPPHKASMPRESHDDALLGLKRTLKEWERTFQEAQGRAPSKNDIKGAPNIAALYKEYHRLKARDAVTRKHGDGAPKISTGAFMDHQQSDPPTDASKLHAGQCKYLSPSSIRQQLILNSPKRQKHNHNPEPLPISQIELGNIKSGQAARARSDAAVAANTNLSSPQPPKSTQDPVTPKSVRIREPEVRIDATPTKHRTEAGRSLFANLSGVDDHNTGLESQDAVSFKSRISTPMRNRSTPGQAAKGSFVTDDSIVQDVFGAYLNKANYEDSSSEEEGTGSFASAHSAPIEDTAPSSLKSLSSLQFRIARRPRMHRTSETSLVPLHPPSATPDTMDSVTATSILGNELMNVPDSSASPLREIVPPGSRARPTRQFSLLSRVAQLKHSSLLSPLDLQTLEALDQDLSPTNGATRSTDVQDPIHHITDQNCTQTDRLQFVQGANSPGSQVPGSKPLTDFISEEQQRKRKFSDGSATAIDPVENTEHGKNEAKSKSENRYEPEGGADHRDKDIGDMSKTTARRRVGSNSKRTSGMSGLRSIKSARKIIQTGKSIKWPGMRSTTIRSLTTYSYSESNSNSQDPYEDGLKDAPSDVLCNHDLDNIEFALNRQSESGEMFPNELKADQNWICAIDPSYVQGLDRKRRYVDLNVALTRMTGLKSFRPKQVNAIKRVIGCQSTLINLPTGFGKSLCYQLPTYIIRNIPNSIGGVTIVVSPMLSLIEDQIRCLPATLKGVSLSTATQTFQAQQKIEALLEMNAIDIVFVTPEKLCSQSFSSIMDKINRVNFVCIDEAHCISEWSHNFRSSYLRLGAAIKETIRASCVIALTGTSTVQANKSICSMLSISYPEGVITGSVIRDNLIIGVTKIDDGDNSARDKQLLHLLKTPVFQTLSPIIIYTMYQVDADRVAMYLRVNGMAAEAYHAGKPADVRNSIQARFMKGDIGFLVATVAFGMGMNKVDVRSVIHYSLPKSLENYIQEIGRAGRDGIPAYCHLLLSSDDYARQRSFAYSDGVDDAAVQRFILKYLNNGGTASTQRHVDSESDVTNLLIPIEGAEKDVDCKHPILETFWNIIEADEDKPIAVFPDTYLYYYVRFFRGAETALCHSDDVVKYIVQCAPKLTRGYKVTAAECCQALKISPTELYQRLASYKKQKRLSLQMEEKCFHIQVRNTWYQKCDEERDLSVKRIRQAIVAKMASLEASRVSKVNQIYGIIEKISLSPLESVEQYSTKHDRSNMTSEALERQIKLYSDIEHYFKNELDDGMTDIGGDFFLSDKQKQSKFEVEMDVKEFIALHRSEITSGRNVAKILLGISSPRYPASEW
ncbi:uncharacterized protein BJ171DRAFT_506367 [Polychytrium aggregatum]|uniref:uncharacterized protein n=1 Tax=Polychytrium aggregatum TaxID=110093 RepID=UPI0022FEB746|nr:uncharacterized protein BJ171DRAFT_506367 [Polychytrium aggregatum]KAI9204185.1 hypothetical protein BJ171DRAFT_506367 [Polychytrium aggregatum]